MKRFAQSLIGTFLLLLVASSAAAQGASSSAAPQSRDRCLPEIEGRLIQQERIAKQILHGRLKAQDVDLNGVLHDMDGNPWMRIEENIWRTIAGGYENVTWTDLQMDRQKEWEGMNDEEPVSVQEEHTGTFARKERLTSELLPDILETFDDYQCRLAMVCAGVEASFEQKATDASGRMSIETPGCRKLLMKPMTSCRESPQDAAFEDVLPQETEPLLVRECQLLAEQMVVRMETFLRIAVSYDAAYRSLLQFAGTFDGVLRALRGDVLAPIEQTLPLLSFPSCFTSSCNE